jgi:hypothetical protein
MNAHNAPVDMQAAYDAAYRLYDPHSWYVLHQQAGKPTPERGHGYPDQRSRDQVPVDFGRLVAWLKKEP